ncbi:type II toxin-antitoxin system VapC family toxin [Oryzibacter oryziterrae]|uniref:type II toxin-antitoxin system VapC family toxin n=1 Tax=Oryzibacter oryziterrae TaxID=2766474 RepID=UPI001F34EBC0|nr:PIN domain-containing protein [Oryzibacter oryziterrae]
MTTRIYVDTNIFISAFEGALPKAEEIRRIMALLETPAFLPVTSELTIAELLVGPLMSGNTVLADRYKAILGSPDELEVIGINRQVLERSAQIRARRQSLKLPDAIHVATAVQAGCRLFLSDDRRMRMDLPDLAFAGSQAGEAVAALESLAP